MTAHSMTRRRHGRGVASLATVMVLFFVIALVAAYASRNLIFEQRTAANQLRSTQALEAAQAGLEWALALVNSGRIDTACNASTDTGNNSFRQRYLSFNDTSGAITPLTRADGSDLTPTCVATSTGWSCSCPVNAAPTLATPGDMETRPAFRVRFRSVPERVRTVRIEVNGCTRLDDGCLSFPARTAALDGRANVSALISMKSALPTAPVAAVTARGAISGDAVIYNTDPDAGGITAQSGGLVTVADSKLRSTPGTPGGLSKVESEKMFLTGALAGGAKPIGERMFAAHFGLWPTSYRDQPAMVVLTCPGGACTDAALRTALSDHPGRPIWVSGTLSIDTNPDIGSAADPVMIFVEGGSLTFTIAATVYGVVYVGRDSGATPADFAFGGPGTLRGALVAEHGIALATNPNIVYDASVNRIIRNTRGSLVLVPGSWKDF